MLDKNELIVLSNLFPQKTKTISELKKTCKYSYERIYSALWSLKNKKILELKKYGNTIVAFPNYNSLITFLGFVYYSICKRDNLLTNLKDKRFLEGLSEKRRKAFIEDINSLESCLKDIESINPKLTEIISIIEISTIPKNKISLFYVGNKSFENELIKLEIRHNIKIQSIAETEESLLEKKEDQRYVNSTVMKGFEKFYRIFYLN